MPAKDVPVHAQSVPHLGAREGIPVREDVIFTDRNGVERSGVRKRAGKALAKLQGALTKMLEPDEVVLYLAQLQAPLSGVEQFTFGHFAYALTKSMLVVTNKRLLDLHLKMKSFGRYEWGRRARSIRLGDIAEAKVSRGLFSGTLKLRYHSGQKEKYWNIRRADSGKLKLLLEQLLPISVGEGSAERGAVSLCPNCRAVLTAGLEHCAQCQLAFATQGQMVRRSILFPGGGYFYVGQKGFGVVDAFTESIFLWWLIIWLLVAAGMPQPFLGPLEPYATQTQAVGTAVVIGLFLVFEKLVTILHGRYFVRKFIPLDNPPNATRWAAWGLAGYATMFLLAWLVIPQEKPLMQVAPDLVVYRADFGIFDAQPQGIVGFNAATTVPRGGNPYGFVLRVRTPRPTLRLRYEFEIEGVPAVQTESGENPLAHEEMAEIEGGVLARFFEVAPDEPRGQQTLKVLLEGVQVGRFTFRVQ